MVLQGRSSWAVSNRDRSKQLQYHIQPLRLLPRVEETPSHAGGVGVSTRLLRLPAPAYSLATLVLLVSTIVLLDLGTNLSAGADTASGLGAPLSDADRETFAVAWLTWRAVAAVAIVVFLFGLAAGVYSLIEARRSGLVPVSGRRLAIYLILPTALVIAVATMIIMGGGRNPDIPVPMLARRTRAVLFTGLVAAVPWVALSWLCQDRCRPYRLRPWGRDTGILGFGELTRLWQRIVACLGAFAVAVAAGVLTAGALRFAFLAARPQCAPGYEPPADTVPAGCVSDFPAINVLLYGAAFAVVGLAIAVPLIASWRSAASEWVDDQRPSDVPEHDETWTKEKDRLTVLLHLDTPVLRNPLTLLSVFTPLITSVLAAFLPQLGG